MIIHHKEISPHNFALHVTFCPKKKKDLVRNGWQKYILCEAYPVSTLDNVYLKKFFIPENCCLFSHRTCVSNVVFYTDSKFIFGFSLARQVPGMIINESMRKFTQQGLSQKPHMVSWVWVQPNIQERFQKQSWKLDFKLKKSLMLWLMEYTL
jgi:hypothetical protein